MSLPVIGHVGILNTRGEDFVACYEGALWVCKNPTPGTGITVTLR
jgi:hypothetical protein